MSGLYRLTHLDGGQPRQAMEPDTRVSFLGHAVRGSSLHSFLDCLLPILAVSLRGYCSILVGSCVMWSGALDRSDVLLSYPVMTTLA